MKIKKISEVLHRISQHRNRLLAAIVCAATGACSLFPQPAHYVTASMPDYDPTVSARMRILSSNDGRRTSFWRNRACYTGRWANDPATIHVDDGFWAAYKYSSASTTIGMPPSPREWMRVDGLQFKDMVKEYVVTAGEPVTVISSFTRSVGDSKTGGYSYSCTTPAVSFAPVAGQDYDVFMEVRGRQCWMSARRIDARGLDEPVRLTDTLKCPGLMDETAEPPTDH